MKAKTFNLTFDTFTIENGVTKESVSFKRIIIADDEKAAERIAQAMINEEVYILPRNDRGSLSNYILSVASVKPTTGLPVVSSISYEYTWKRVVVSLGLTNYGLIHYADTIVGLTEKDYKG